MSGRKKETRSPRRETPPRLRFLEGASAQTGRGGGACRQSATREHGGGCVGAPSACPFQRKKVLELEGR